MKAPAKRTLIGAGVLLVVFVGGFLLSGSGSANPVARCTTIVSTVGTVTETVVSTVVSTVTQTVTVTTSATTTTAPPPPGLLTWKPPGYPDYAGYVTVNVPTAGGVVTMDNNTDYRLVLPPGGTTKGLDLDGGRNIVLIGGTISVDSAWYPGADNCAIIVRSNTGTVDGRVVHIEGVHAKGAYLGDFLQAEEPTSFTTGHTIIRVENVYADRLVGAATGVHADLFGAWGGLKELDADKVTAYTEVQGAFLAVADGWPAGTDYRMRRVNVRDAGGVSQFQWWATDESGRTHHVYTDQVYVERPGATLANIAWPTPSDSIVARRPVYSSDTEGPYATWPNMLYTGDGTRTVANWDNTADGKVRLGVPPAGNFVDPAMVGENYVSPGYA